MEAAAGSDRGRLNPRRGWLDFQRRDPPGDQQRPGRRQRATAVLAHSCPGALGPTERHTASGGFAGLMSSGTTTQPETNLAEASPAPSIFRSVLRGTSLY